jgi:type IV pilus assembly protein PilV
MDLHNGLHRQAGFTLLEILITIVILSIGLLGIAGMQATGLRNNHSAYTKTQAANLAMDMADRIRANPDARADYAGFDTNDAAIPENPGCISSDNGCPPAQLATYDKYEWSRPLTAENKPLLPEGRGVITQNGDEFTITILWLEPAYQGVTRNDCGFEGLAEDTACFQMSFIP